MSTNISVGGPYTPGDIYFGDCCIGDREATAQEAADYEAKRNKTVSNATIMMQISAFEAKQARGVREAVLTGDLTRLQGIETEIIALRLQLKS